MHYLFTIILHYTVPDGPQICTLQNCRNYDAAAEAQSGNATALESGAKGKEELVNALGHLTSHSLPFGIPSLARWSYTKSHILYRASGEYQGVSF